MAELSQSGIENQAGDLLFRRRLVEDVLQEGVEYRADTSSPWNFGPLTVAHHPADGFLKVHDPDGGLHEVEIPTEDPIAERIETIEYELRGVWSDWLDAL